MLVKHTETLHLDASPEEVWKLLRDTPRFTRLLPGVEHVAPLERLGSEAYAAQVSEKVGPFKISLTLEVQISEAREPSLLKARLRGADSAGTNRVTGSLQVALSPAEMGTQMQFEVAVEVLGKLATLGAVPIRRRTTQSFAEFARNLQGQFAVERK
jgi:carbon monoxide dehydrogenase subunit G